MIRKEKRRFLRFSKIIFLSFISLFIVIILLTVHSGFFSIKQIEIQGDKVTCVGSDQLKTSSNLLGQNFFLIDTQKTAEDLKGKFICVKQIVLTRLPPDTVQMVISSRQPMVILVGLKDQPASPSFLIENIATPDAQAVQDSFVVDSEGVIFSKDLANLSMPKIYIYDSDIFLGKKLADDTGNSLKILEKVQRLGVSVKKSLITQDFFIINPDTSDPKIIFRLDSKIDSQLASLQLILTDAKIDLKELEFIDLRFDKPIVRFAPKNHGQR